jgi:hypothetical protein
VWLAANEDQEFPAPARFATSPTSGSKQQFQALATRYGKARRIYLGTVDAAPIRIWPRDPPWSKTDPRCSAR